MRLPPVSASTINIFSLTSGKGVVLTTTPLFPNPVVHLSKIMLGDRTPAGSCHTLPHAARYRRTNTNDILSMTRIKSNIMVFCKESLFYWPWKPSAGRRADINSDMVSVHNPTGHRDSAVLGRDGNGWARSGAFVDKQIGERITWTVSRYLPPNRQVWSWI